MSANKIQVPEKWIWRCSHWLESMIRRRCRCGFGFFFPKSHVWTALFMMIILLLFFIYVLSFVFMISSGLSFSVFLKTYFQFRVFCCSTPIYFTAKLRFPQSASVLAFPVFLMVGGTSKEKALQCARLKYVFMSSFFSAWASMKRDQCFLRFGPRGTNFSAKALWWQVGDGVHITQMYSQSNICTVYDISKIVKVLLCSQIDPALYVILSVVFPFSELLAVCFQVVRPKWESLPTAPFQICVSPV